MEQSSPEMNPVIDVKKVFKSFRKGKDPEKAVEALKGVSLQKKKGNLY